MKISIFGLGYVGAVSLACLARDGHQVIGVDIDEDKLGLIRDGKSPIIEEGIQELMAEVVASGRVSVTDDCAGAVSGSDLSFVCVGTPSAANGSQDLTAMRRLAAQLGEALRHKSSPHVIVVRSTVEPGTVEDVIAPLIAEHSGKKAGEDFQVCFQPEFLREGSSIKDYDNPPFTVIGGASGDALAKLKDLFGHLPGEFFSTDTRTAETLKYGCNTFHALKVTFANEMGRLCQSLGVDSHAVMQLLCEDKRLNISPAYLRPGFAFGGSCLPKDLKALMYMGRRNDVTTPMLANVMASNQAHVDHAIETVLAEGRKKVGLIGISFKSGTDDLRESPLVTVAETFIGKGIDLRIYDPEVNLSRLMGANRRYIEQSIPHIASLMRESCEQLIDEAEIIVVGLSDKAIVETLMTRHRSDQLIVDLVGLPSPKDLRGRYQGVCW